MLLTQQRLKLRCYFDIAWGLLILISLIGTFVGRFVAVYACVMTCMMWAVTKILMNGLDAVDTLRILRGQNKPPNATDD